MSMLDVQNLTFSYGDKVILRDISFRLLKGEHIGLVGANGTGKTTLLRIMTGELLVDNGSVVWLPRVKVGYLEQHSNMPAHETMYQYLSGAFAELFQVEAELLDVTELMSNAKNDDLTSLLERFSKLQSRLEEDDFYHISARVHEIAAGLGLTEIGLDRKVSELSGGQRTKLRLARLLLEQPQVLLLDEPTNYLDTEHIDWLTSYLRNYPHTFLLISHDIIFLNNVVNIIFHLEFQQLHRYVGNYDKFLAASEMRTDQIQQQYSQQQDEIKKLETFIAKNKARASTAKRAKSREKKLSKIERIEKPITMPPPKFSFKEAPAANQVVMTAEELLIGYEKALLPPLNLKLMKGDKVALIGYNGIGKSTTLKTLLGLLPPLAGNIVHGDKVVPAYFAQETRFTLDHSALQELWEIYPNYTQQEVRSALARCGLTQKHINKPLKSLSGGEQTKVMICKLMLRSSNWLILDEPTNHLDVVAKEALKKALIAYTGTILLVAHEPDFYENWVTEVWDVTSW